MFQYLVYHFTLSLWFNRQHVYAKSWKKYHCSLDEYDSNVFCSWVVYLDGISIPLCRNVGNGQSFSTCECPLPLSDELLSNSDTENKRSLYQLAQPTQRAAIKAQTLHFFTAVCKWIVDPQSVMNHLLLSVLFGCLGKTKTLVIYNIYIYSIYIYIYIYIYISPKNIYKYHGKHGDILGTYTLYYYIDILLFY